MRVFLFAASTVLLPLSAQAATLTETRLLPGDGSASDFFGQALAASGSAAVVGAHGDDDNGADSGSAYIFDVNSGNQIHKLSASDAAAGDEFGYSVSLSGTTALVGAYMNDDAGGDSGSAYVFDSATGSQTHKLTASDAAASDYFGISVAVSGTSAVIGARNDDDAGANSGAVYVFDTATGAQVQKLTATDGAARDFFGRAVAVDGSTAVVGAYGDDDNGSLSGSAYVFDTATGAQLQKLTASDGFDNDRFGSAVAVTGNVALVGAYLDDDHGLSSGSVYLFDTTTGAQISKLTASDGEAFDYFGRSIAVAGDLAIIGADGDDDNGTDSGSAYIFEISTGRQLAKILASDGLDGDAFGQAVALSEDFALAGAGFADGARPDSGAAYLYAYDTANLTAPVPLPAAFWLLGSALVLLALRRRRG